MSTACLSAGVLHGAWCATGRPLPGDRRTMQERDCRIFDSGSVVAAFGVYFDVFAATVPG
jgi:hypothetical protein